MGSDSDPTRLQRPSAPSERGSASTDEQLLDTTGPRYTSGEEIGRGGMGRVVEAHDNLLGRVVAIKEVLTDDSETLKRFRREIRITARLEHPSIVPVHDAGDGKDGEPPFYVMRRVSGRPLEELTEEANTLDKRLALIPNILAATQAIAHAHQRGVLHRDLKPSNILVGELGETIVIDWGLAKVIGEADDQFTDALPMPADSLRTRIGVVAGTPGFMAPEQARGDELGPQTDVWAIGACLHFVLARKPPHYQPDTDGDELITLTAARPVPPVAMSVRGLPKELAAIIDRALAFDSKSRYPDGAALAAELQRFLAGQLVAAHEYSFRERLARWMKRNRTAVAVGALALITLAIVSTTLLLRIVHERDVANEERKKADRQRIVAEDARAVAQDRVDAELIGRSRSLMMTDPVRAAAVLKQLTPGSRRIEEARGVLQSARAHGASMVGVQISSNLVLATTLSPTNDRVLITHSDGISEIVELATAKVVASHQFARGTFATWIDNGRRLVTTRTRAAVWDPQSATVEDLGLIAPLHVVAVGSDVIAAVDDQGAIGRLDTTAKKLTTFAQFESDAEDRAVDVTSDGRFIIATSSLACRVYRSDGTLVSSVDTGESAFHAVSENGRVAVGTLQRLVELDTHAATPVWTVMAAMPREITGSSLVVLRYEGEDLWLLGRQAVAKLVRGEPGDWSVSLQGVSWIVATPVGPNQFLTVPPDNKLRIVDVDHTRSIVLPTPISNFRISSRRGSSTAVLAMPGLALVIDLRFLLPHLVDENAFALHTVFADDNTLMVSTYGAPGNWVDIATGAFKDVEADISPCCGLLGVGASEPPGVVAIEGHNNDASQPVFFPRPYARGVAYPLQSSSAFGFGDYAVVITDAREIFASKLGEKPRFVATLDGALQTWVIQHDGLYVGTKTELLHIQPSTGTVLDRKSFSTPLDGSVGVYRGRLITGREHSLEYADAPGHSLADLHAPPLSISETVRGVLVTYEDNATDYVILDGPTPQLIPLGAPMVAWRRHRVLLEQADGVDLFDLRTLARSRVYDKARSFTLDLSPGEDLLLEYDNRRRWIWPLESSDGDVSAAVNATTNAIEQSGVLVWPWQISH